MTVLIVGAGPTGLTLGLALRQRGIPFRIIDKLPQRLPWSRALGVQARTLEVMQRLGLAGQFIAAGQHVAGMCIHLGDDKLRIDLPHVHPTLPTIIMVPQHVSERILEDALASVERGVEFVGLDGAAARLRHADGTEERVVADWIVGCDGAHSDVRHAANASFAGRQYAEHWLLADCSVDGLEADRIHAFPGAENPGVFFPIPGDAWRGVVGISPDKPDPPDHSMAPFARDGLTVRDPTWWTRFRVSHRQIDHARHGHLIMLGDAAHIHSPVGGQGMNLGVQDAFALAAALARPAASVSEAVDRWAAERHRVARRVVLATDMMTKAMLGHSSLLRPVRRLGMGLVASSHRLQAGLAKALSGMDYPDIPA